MSQETYGGSRILDENIPPRCSFCPAICEASQTYHELEMRQQQARNLYEGAMDDPEFNAMMTTTFHDIMQTLGISPESIADLAELGSLKPMDILDRDTDELYTMLQLVLHKVSRYIETCTGTMELTGHDISGHEYKVTLCTSTELYESEEGFHLPAHVERFNPLEGHDPSALVRLVQHALSRHRHPETE